MKQEHGNSWPINQGVILIVGLIVILATIKFTAELFVPFLLALSLTIIINPLIAWFAKCKIPPWLTGLVLLMLLTVPMIILINYLTAEINDLLANIDSLKDQFTSVLKHITLWLNKFGVTQADDAVQKVLQSSSLRSIAHSIITETGSQLSNFLMVLILVIYMLLEASSMQAKLRYVARENAELIDNLAELINRVQNYFVIKLQTSLITGVCIYLGLIFFGIKYAILWAVLAFVLNFVPIIGSIIAAIPPLFLALVSQSLSACLWLTGYFLVVELVIGNVIEPKMMSKGLGLSAFIVLLSLSFWGWILGPTGIILSVPLTMSLQTYFAHYTQTQWLAIMLGDNK